MISGMLDEHIYFLESDSNFYNFCYDSSFWSAHPIFSDIHNSNFCVFFLGGVDSHFLPF